MKFLLFADLHHSWNFDAGTYEDLKFFEKRAKDEDCDFIIHAGDLCHGPTYKDNPEYVKAYNELDFTTYHCPGNHDFDHSKYEDVFKAYGLEKGYYYIDGKGARLIVLDPNYYYEDGKYHHYSEGDYYYKDRDHVPPEQLEWLRDAIATSENPCLLISHESFERPDGVKNRAAVLDIINEANRRRPNSVLMCINGHSHKDFIRMIDNVCFFEINSASFEILDSRHKFYPQELCERIKDVDATLVINDPICAVVTVEGTTVDIKGMESSFFMGVTKDMTDDPLLDEAGRLATPNVSSLHVTF